MDLCKVDNTVMSLVFMLVDNLSPGSAVKDILIYVDNHGRVDSTVFMLKVFILQQHISFDLPVLPHHSQTQETSNDTFI